MKRTNDFINWWVNVVKEDAITNKQMEEIIYKLENEECSLQNR